MMVALAKPQYAQKYTLPLDTVIHGDALVELRKLPDACIDAIVCDPPAGISFMGRAFDSDKGGRDHWIAWLTDIMREALRCLKPGGHAFVWSLPRTSHWTATALENAGFEVRDCVTHLLGTDTLTANFVNSLNAEQYTALEAILQSQGEPSVLSSLFGSGFPKSCNISLAIDKHFKAKREVIGVRDSYRPNSAVLAPKEWFQDRSSGNITIPATPEAQQWSGYGTALKPSQEMWWLCRKPLAEKTIAEQVLATGTGGLNIDATRIGTRANAPQHRPASASGIGNGKNCYGTREGIAQTYTQGRFPSNTLLSHTLWCVPIGEKRICGSHGHFPRSGESLSIFGSGHDRPVVDYSNNGYADEDNCETVQAYSCAEGCPVRALDEMSGIRKSGGGIKSKAGHSIGMLRGENAYHFQYDGAYCEPSIGTASRYFQQFSPDLPFYYAAKASRRERNMGLECMLAQPSSRNGKMVGTPEHGAKYDAPEQNTHPTVKSQQLLRYLVRMITPPDGIVLDCFAGSGSTFVAAIHEGMHFIGIEMNNTEQEPYVDICNARIAQAYREVSR